MNAVGCRPSPLHLPRARVQHDACACGAACAVVVAPRATPRARARAAVDSKDKIREPGRRLGTTAWRPARRREMLQPPPARRGENHIISAPAPRPARSWARRFALRCLACAQAGGRFLHSTWGRVWGGGQAPRKFKPSRAPLHPNRATTQWSVRLLGSSTPDRLQVADSLTQLDPESSSSRPQIVVESDPKAPPCRSQIDRTKSTPNRPQIDLNATPN